MVPVMMDRRAFLAGSGAAAMLASGCSVDPRNPNVARIYGADTVIDPALRRPLVTIPGLLGTRLRIGRDGPFVWGGPDRLSLNPINRRNTRLLSLPVGDGETRLASLRDEIRHDGVLRKARATILFATVEEQVYDGLTAALNAGGYEFSRTVAEEEARSGQNPGSLEFPYDWRRDIVEAAKGLDLFIERKARQIERVRRERYGRSIEAEAMRFDFVAHSMGTLVLRYWLMYGGQDLPADGSMPDLTWAGARRSACAVLMAPPNLGSVGAVDGLVMGKSFGPLQPFYPPALLGTHHTLYQLMPRDRHNRVRLGSEDGPSPGSLYDAATWEENAWGLFDPDSNPVLDSLMDGDSPVGRRARLRAHLQRMLDRAARLQRALDIGGTPPGVDLFLVVGTGLDTPATAIIDPESRRISRILEEEGDGVVLRASALMTETQGGYEPARRGRKVRYRTTLLLPGEHVQLTSSSVFADNLIYWLRDTPA
ncbi:MAG: hypothetical protein AAF698_02140 [Pseudomonadota bacterium]